MTSTSGISLGISLVRKLGDGDGDGDGVG